LLQSVVVNAKLLCTHQGLAAQFEENAFVLHAKRKYLNIPRSFCTENNKGHQKRQPLLLNS